MKAAAARVLCIAVFALPVWAQTPLPTFEGYVTDQAGIVGDDAKARLETKLREFEERTGSQVTLLIVLTTLPEKMPDYARRVAIERVKTRTKPDNGAILVISKDKRDVHLEVSPALARTLTARNAAVITENTLPPAFPGSVSDGIEDALRRVMWLIDAGPGSWVSTTTSDDPEYLALDRGASVTRFLEITVLILAVMAAASYGVRRFELRARPRDPRGAGTWPTPPTAPMAPAPPSRARPRRWPYALAIIAINLVPLWGVLVLGWRVLPLFLLFWLENIVIMFIGALRAFFAVPDHPAEWLAKPVTVPLGMLGPAIFVVGHGMAIFGVFAKYEYVPPAPSGPPLEILWYVIELIEGFGLLPALAAIAAAHLFLFLWSYILGGEWRRPPSLGFDPVMARLIVLHMTIIIGGIITVSSGSPVWALVVLVALKIAGELLVHFGAERPVERKE